MYEYKKTDRADAIRTAAKLLEQGVKNVFTDGKYAAYLSAMSKFHNYSFRNSMLIFLQNPSASLVAGFNTWKKDFSRSVKRGEHGIKIIAPLSTKIEVETGDKDKTVLDGDPATEKKEFLNFRAVTVFDVSQTDGKPLPTIARKLGGSAENYDFMLRSLRGISPVPVEFENIGGDVNGFFSIAERKIAIKSGLSEAQTLKTLVHEIAHAMLHSAGAGREKDRSTKEVEAESVAFVVCNRFGLETDEYSFGYIAGWSSGKDVPELSRSLETIQKISAEIIGKIEARTVEISDVRDAGSPEENLIDKPKFTVVLTRREDDKVVPEIVNEAETEIDSCGGYSLPFGESHDTETSARHALTLIDEAVLREADEIFPHRPKPVSKADLQLLREITPARKSVLNFSDNEAKITRKFSDSLYAETGAKSPYQRRAEDWRQAETTPTAVLKIQDKGVDFKAVRDDIFRERIENINTNRTAQISRKGLEKAVKYEQKQKENVIYNALYQVEKFVEHGVLLDTNLSEKNNNSKADGTMFMHKLYAPFYFRDEFFVAKLSVEQFADGTGGTLKRLYNAQDIRIEPLRHIEFTDKRLARSVLNNSTSISVSQLFEIVNSFDKNFYKNSPEREKVLGAVGISDSGEIPAAKKPVGTAEKEVRYEVYSRKKIQQAREADLVNFFERNGYKVKKQGREFHIEGFGGLYINPEKGVWNCFSEGKGGHNSIDCLQHMLGYDFKTAVSSLVGGEDLRVVRTRKIPEKPAPPEFSEAKMPEREGSIKRVYAFLTATRKIDAKLVSKMVNEGRLYQDTRGNAVFVHRDADGKAVGAELQGTYTPPGGSRFRGVSAGTHGTVFAVSFAEKGVPPGKIYVFESAIDLLSFQQMCDPKKLAGCALISMAGLKDETLKPYIDSGAKIFSCVDNDEAGRKFNERNGLQSGNLLARENVKDWNELLQKRQAAADARVKSTGDVEQTAPEPSKIAEKFKERHPKF
jgi:hypothetical protein